MFNLLSEIARLSNKLDVDTFMSKKERQRTLLQIEQLRDNLEKVRAAFAREDIEIEPDEE